MISGLKVVLNKMKAGATKLVLSNFVLPNGKMLRDCTFAECAMEGGWLTALSKMGQPGDKVGAVLHLESGVCGE
jgi:hypothetical protein